MSDLFYPPWVVLHIPHDSVNVPPEVRNQFLIDDDQLANELRLMTDHMTLTLFAHPTQSAVVVRAPVSRLVVDVERFDDNLQEPMADRGMGAIYSVTSNLTPLRGQLSAVERDSLMKAYYHPHHAKLEAAVTSAIEIHGRCLVIDCHSFPSQALPYERADAADIRPDICIGTDDFHTNSELAHAFVAAFRAEGWSVSLNEPFSGALVPSSRYKQDHRVGAVMVEINRRLYLCENDGTPLPTFAAIAQRVRNCCKAAIKLLPLQN